MQLMNRKYLAAAVAVNLIAAALFVVAWRARRTSLASGVSPGLPAGVSMNAGTAGSGVTPLTQDPANPTVPALAANLGVAAVGEVVPVGVVTVTVPPDMRARVARVHAEPGQRVHRGEVLADLDPLSGEEELLRTRAAVESAEAELDLARDQDRPGRLSRAAEAVRRAQARYDLARRPYRPERLRQAALDLERSSRVVAEARARLDLARRGTLPGDMRVAEEGVEIARTRLEAAAAEHERNRILVEKDLIPRVKLEESETERKVAQANLERAEARLAQAGEGARAEEIRIAQANLDQALLRAESDRVGYDMLRRGSRPEETAQAESELREARLAYRLLRGGGAGGEVRKAMADLRRRRLEEMEARRLLGRYRLRAPVAGVVIARNVDPGEVAAYVAPRSGSIAPESDERRGLFVIADDHEMEFRADVDQSSYYALRAGTPATVTIAALPGRSFKGTVTRVNPLVEGRSAARTFKVWVRLPNADRILVAGQTGRVVFDAPTEAGPRPNGGS